MTKRLLMLIAILALTVSVCYAGNDIVGSGSGWTSAVMGGDTGYFSGNPLMDLVTHPDSHYSDTNGHPTWTDTMGGTTAVPELPSSLLFGLAAPVGYSVTLLRRKLGR
jgi:hypothetical protein